LDYRLWQPPFELVRLRLLKIQLRRAKHGVSNPFDELRHAFFSAIFR
jgi:hypothetical protein